MIEESFFKIFNKALNSKYYRQVLPCEFDEVFIDLLQKLKTVEGYRLDEFINNLSVNDAKILGLFAERMASYVVRKEKLLYINSAIFALIIYSRSQNSREIFIILSLLYNSIVKIGLNPKSIFKEWGLLDRNDILKNFLNRSSKDKKIESMGYSESKDKYGFIYIRNW